MPVPSMPNQDEVRADWNRRGFSCDLWTDPPGQVWSDFVHATDEIVMVLEGEVEFEVAGQKSTPAIGEEVLIPAGEKHSARTSNSGGSKWLYGYRR
ncbi:MAG: cupin domain-containing protein [Planctomycetota bacterium]|nr:cupin domain-containing protein [Planctomycetota bacterium]